MQSAEAAWRQGQLQESIAILQRAQRMAPANIPILLQLGRLQGFAANYAEAERYYEQAVRFASNKTETLIRAGKQSLDFANSALAQRYLERAAAQSDVTAEACVLLAELYERLHLSEEVSALVARARSIEPENQEAALAKARLDRQAGQTQSAEKALKSVSQKAARETRIRAHYELGGLLDRDGRFDEAMAAFLEGKALQAIDATPLKQALRRDRSRIMIMRDSITREQLAHWRALAPELAPSRKVALLCGHARSGTTLLEKVLDAHPGLISAEETDVFRAHAYVPLRKHLPPETLMLPSLDAATPAQLRASRAEYFRQIEIFLGQAVGDRMLLDKNPAYNFLIPAFVRIFPEARFLVALRDPRDVCMSCFTQHFRPLGLPQCEYLSLGDTVEQYAFEMSLWQKLGPILENPWMEVKYEDLVDDLPRIARQALEFFDLPWDDRVVGFNSDGMKNRLVRSPTFAEVAKPVTKRAVGRWKNYQKYLEPHLSVLEPFVKAFGYE